MVEILNNPLPRNESLPYFLQPFPHEDPFHIDMRTVIKGDGKTYPKRFSQVVYQFTGQWLRDKGCTEWIQNLAPENPLVVTNIVGQNELIIGFQLVLMAMSLNETARVWIPESLGNTDFVCEVTLIAVEHPDDLVADRCRASVGYPGDGDEDDPLSGLWGPLDVRVHTQFLRESGTFCIENEELDKTIENELNTNDEDAPHFDVDAMYVMDCRRDKYRRKIQSKRKREKRRRLKRKYRKWDGKSKEKRVRRKMRKYRTIHF